MNCPRARSGLPSDPLQEAVLIRCAQLSKEFEESSTWARHWGSTVDKNSEAVASLISRLERQPTPQETHATTNSKTYQSSRFTFGLAYPDADLQLEVPEQSQEQSISMEEKLGTHESVPRLQLKGNLAAASAWACADQHSRKEQSMIIGEKVGTHESVPWREREGNPGAALAGSEEQQQKQRLGRAAAALAGLGLAHEESEPKDSQASMSCEEELQEAKAGDSSAQIPREEYPWEMLGDRYDEGEQDYQLRRV